MVKRIVPVLLVVGLLALPGSTEQAPAGPRILVCHVQKVVDGCDEAREVVAELQKEKVETQKKFDERIRKIKQQADELKKKRLNERDKKFLGELYEMEFQLGTLKAEAARKVVELSDRELRLLKAILQDVQSAAEKIMTQRGADVVIASRLEVIDITREQDVAQEYVSRRVLAYRDPKADITKDVLKLVNEWYAKRKKPAGRPPAEREKEPAGAAESKPAGSGSASNKR
jgi:Skp family chaperone for outer membrane proteins